MEKILNYSILETLSVTPSSIKYRVRSDIENKNYVIKKFRKQNSSQVDIARFRQEYDMIRNLGSEGIIKVFDCIELEDGIALVLEDFEGVKLKRVLEESLLSVKPFLRMAIRLSEILGQLHQKNIIHKDIKPHNILVSKKHEVIKYTDFGVSQLLTRENEMIYDPRMIEETLYYMSPEQTGRMNRSVDYRSDFYSLGITFYEMLTGGVPFAFNDPMEVIHAHIAKNPVPPHEVNKSVPGMISMIVMKLLSKNAEERYQNSFGLMADLKECLQQFDKISSIEQFELASHDSPIKFNIPQKFFGRENEIDTIMASIEKMRHTGKSEIILVSGNPGIGKSALVNEINKSIVINRGYFITGKHEQFGKDVPYSALIQAFIGLTRQILTESRERIYEWKDSLLEKLGPNGKVITDMIPELELIIGKQPDVPVLGPDEMNNRFMLVFKNFVHVFASSDHPLVLFLDDLQWADLASLTLIKNIIIDPETQHLFFIGSYRDTEVNAVSPLSLTLTEISKEGIDVNTIALVPLNIEDINNLISSFLRSEKTLTQPLAELVYSKTNGNPFFINQFLKTLYDEKKLHLIPAEEIENIEKHSGGWYWDIEKISAMSVTDNVVELMAERISKLPDDMLDTLKTAACIGNRFEVEILSNIQGVTIDVTLSLLAAAVNEGLILYLDNVYVFYHDRIMEAVYSLINPGEKAEMHVRVGRVLLQITGEEDLNEKIIHIVTQMNAGKSLITAEDEQFDLARLNLRAGIKAKMSAAYSSALIYLRTGIEIIQLHDKNRIWNEHYNLSLSLYSEIVETAYLCTDYDEMDFYAEIVIPQARTIFDKAPVYETQIRKFMAQNSLMDALAVGLEVLTQLGIKFPKKISVLHILFNLLKIKWMLIGKNTDDIYNHPPMEDPKIILAMRILCSCAYPAYYGRPKLLPLIVFKFVSLSLKYGNCAFSPYGFAGYGLILCSIGEIDNGYAFGRMSQQLLVNLDVQDQKSRPIETYNNFIRHWKEHAKETLPGFLEGYKVGLETGDLEFAVLNIEGYCHYSFLLGKELTAHEHETEMYMTIAESFNQKTQLQILKLHHQSVINLQDENNDAFTLRGPVYNEEIMMPMHISSDDHTAICFFHHYKSMLYFLFNLSKKAIGHSEICEKYIDAMVGQMYVVHHYFYDSLICLALYDAALPEDKKKYLNKALKNAKKLKKWAVSAPMNHLHKYELVQAEICRVKGQVFPAMEYYKNAIFHAAENEYLNEEAVAYERAGVFFSQLGHDEISFTYINNAYQAYSRWGAKAKLRDLEKTYPDVIIKPPDLSTESAAAGSMSAILDISTVIKTSQAISSEIDLDKLVKTILSFAIQNAGAGKGFLFMENENTRTLTVEASYSVDNSEDISGAESRGADPKFSAAIVNYVHTTKEDVLLGNACEEGMFSNDNYIRQNRSKSILCTPIINKGKLTGILYLENNLSVNAFTPERLELMRVLSSQAAISLENTRLIAVEKKKAAMDHEVMMAERIQRSLLPKEIPDIGDTRFAFKYVPMASIGGDFVNIYHKKKDNKIGLFICDVSGHGIYAAMVASMVSNSLDFFWDENFETPSVIFKELSKFLKGKMGGNFFTGCICSLDIDTGMMVMSNAGHPPLMVLRKSGTVEMKDTVGRLICDFFVPNQEDVTFKLEEGDIVVLYTDGIIEAENPEGERIGDDDDVFCAWVKGFHEKSSSPDELCEMIYQGAVQYAETEQLNDDFTILVVEYKL